MKTQLRKGQKPETPDINQEYANLCAELGDLVTRFEERSAWIKEKIRELKKTVEAAAPNE